MNAQRHNPTPFDLALSDDHDSLERPFNVAEILFEPCERRLVLSAQLMFDVLGDQALELHGDMNIAPHVESVPIISHLQEAHAASGWDTVQQRFGLTGKGQTVAVIDSGIAWDHVALGQGYGPGYRVVGGWDFSEENDANPYDDGPLGFHGTHVAGIIGSDDPNHSGVAPDVDLVALRVFNDAGQGQLSWVERALQWVHDNRNSFENPITTVNLSLGTVWNSDVVPAWATLEEEFQTLFNDGIIVTASAGNSFQQYLSPGVSYPAASPYVLPVASVDDDGRLSDFSQRDAQVIAAPGRNIVSTVPDYVLGRDGKIDDFAAASGTSMAAPYMAGASVLVRQALEMIGTTGINLTSIAGHLHDTADSVYDAVTGQTYDRLNLERAIDTLIPHDNVGDTFQSSSQFDLATSHELGGWINSLGEQDVYHFTPASNGSLHIDADSSWLDTLHWSLQSSAGEAIANGHLAAADVNLVAGQTYQLIVSADHQIGSFQVDLGFTPQSTGDSAGGGESALPPVGEAITLGAVDYSEQSLTAGHLLHVQASHDGIFSVQWTNHDAPVGSLAVTRAGSTTLRDSTWDSGSLRIDLNVTVGQWLDIQLPGSAVDQGDLTLANVLAQSGSSLSVHGTQASDQIGVDLSYGLKVRFGDIEYAYPAGTIQQLNIDTSVGNDELTVVGSAQSDKVDLRPTTSTIENSQIHIAIASAEQISFNGGGGPDRIYLYDSDGDDTLTARPHSAELVGAGYRFAVEQVDRIYIHATGSGQDYAYLYDSAGDDRLSVRPQFSSLSGDGYFNYVSGFERVYAYANVGGNDIADLYDSAGNDRFTTSGVTASIVGPGFSSFTRSFEQVNAHADAGGHDLATLYGSSAQTQWQQGSDFIRFSEQGMTREARGFQSIETFVAGQAYSLATASTDTYEQQMSVVPNPLTNLSVPAVTARPSSHWNSGLSSMETVELHQVNEASRQPSELEPFHSSLARETLPELQVLRETRQMCDWLSERLQLPDETLLVDPEAEFALIDEIFRYR
ncbi:MAG: S8 family serine peptidase [Aureliella sp.]